MADSPETTRWFIVHLADGKRAEDSPGMGFDSRERAEDFHRAVFRDDPKLEVREIEIP